MEEILAGIKGDLITLEIGINEFEKKMRPYKEAYDILKKLSTCNTCRNHCICPMERRLGERVRYDCFFYIFNETGGKVEING